MITAVLKLKAHIIIEVEEAGPVDVQNGIERMPAPGNFRHYNWVTSIWEVPKLTSKYVSNFFLPYFHKSLERRGPR